MPRQVTLRTVQVSRLAQTLIHNRTSANINLLPSFSFFLFLRIHLIYKEHATEKYSLCIICFQLIKPIKENLLFFNQYHHHTHSKQGQIFMHKQMSLYKLVRLFGRHINLFGLLGCCNKYCFFYQLKFSNSEGSGRLKPDFAAE